MTKIELVPTPEQLAELRRNDARREEQRRINAILGEEFENTDLPYSTILSIEDMMKRLVLIGESSAVVDRVTYRVRKKEAAVVEYAASVYPLPDKPTKTGKCLEAWKMAEKRITVDTLSWVPGSPVFCPPPEAMGGALTSFNTWRGIKQFQVPVNWQELCRPFVEHLGYLIPIESERKRFTQWLAHILQRPEVLPHTSYLMVTPATGTGRNWLASLMVRILRGYVGTGVKLSELLDSGFTGRLSHKLLIILDEVREGSTQRYARANALRQLITEENRFINPKYGVQSVEKNCARFLLFSNFFDALPFDNEDRRIIIIANPTKCRDEAYYTNLYGALENPDFIASVWHYLNTYSLAGFNPGAHAPMNEAKQQAIIEMRSELENDLIEFRNQCLAQGKGLVCRRLHIKDFLADRQQYPKDMQLTHAIRNVGMINSGEDVELGNRQTDKIIIVDTEKWTVPMIKAATAQARREAVGIEQRSPVAPPSPR